MILVMEQEQVMVVIHRYQLIKQIIFHPININNHIHQRLIHFMKMMI